MLLINRTCNGYCHVILQFCPNVIHLSIPAPFFLSAPSPISISLFTHRSTTIITSCSSVQTPPPPPPPQSQPLTSPPLSSSRRHSSNSILPNPNFTPISSSGCSHNCPHFESCSGCNLEDNLHSPVVLQEAATFFKKYCVSDFTFDACRLWG